MSQVRSVKHELRSRKVNEKRLLIVVNLVRKDQFLINATIVLVYM